MELTEKIIEKAIANYLKINGKTKNCTACHKQKSGTDIALCPAHELDQALADWELSERLLNEKYFDVINASKRCE